MTRARRHEPRMANLSLMPAANLTMRSPFLALFIGLETPHLSPQAFFCNVRYGVGVPDWTANQVSRPRLPLRCRASPPRSDDALSLSDKHANVQNEGRGGSVEGRDRRALPSNTPDGSAADIALIYADVHGPEKKQE